MENPVKKLKELAAKNANRVKQAQKTAQRMTDMAEAAKKAGLSE